MSRKKRWNDETRYGTWPPVDKRLTRAWEVVIPGWHPPSVNELLRAHWGRAAQLKRDAYELLKVFVRQAAVPAAAGKRGYAFAYQLGPRKRACDPNNYLKVLLDGLVACGALRDDNRQWSEEVQAAVFWRGPINGTRIWLADMAEEGARD